MSKKLNKSENLLCYHYELTNDDRQLLMFEPNVFKSFEDARIHCSCLSYLSGTEYYLVNEDDINRLSIFLPRDKDFVPFPEVL